MTAKIIQFNQYKHVEFVDLFRQGNEMKFDILLNINNAPFTLRNVSISGIKKDKIKYNYDSIYHKSDDKNGLEVCPFCGAPFENSLCDTLSKEKDEIFSNSINKELFFPMMSYYYNDNDQTFFEKLAKVQPEDFKPLFFGLSEGTFIQCIFRYKNELLLFQDIAGSNNIDVLPLIFYFEQEQNELHLYIEYLLPQNLLPITNAINKSIHAPNAQIFDTTGMSLKELYVEFKEKNNKS